MSVRPAGTGREFRRRRRTGFTMIEMITAVAISVVVVAGLYGVFNMHARQFVYQDIQTTMHQNLRFASDVLSRSVRMAGYGTGGDVTGVLGFAADGTVDQDETLPAIIEWDDWSGAGHDAITVVYADPMLEMNTAVTTIEDCGTSTLTFDMNMLDYSTLIANYGADELLMCWDYGNPTGTVAWMWKTASGGGDAVSGTISLDPNEPGEYLDYDNTCASDENLPPVISCSRANVMSFYIDDVADGVGPGSAEHPVLMMDLDFSFPDVGPDDDDVPLVDDIEDIQFAYCLAGLDCSLSDSWVDTITRDEGKEVWAVRISVVARSERQDPRDLHEEVRPALENHAAATTADGYYREVLTTTVTVRNLRYQVDGSGSGSGSGSGGGYTGGDFIGGLPI